MECSHRTFWLPGCLQMPLPFSLETKSPPDNRSGLWTAFFPSQLRADSYLPHHPEQDFTGNTDPSNKSKRAVMIFFLNFSLYNKEAPKDKLNLISGLSNLDTTKKKKKGGGKPVAHLRTPICEFPAVESHRLYLHQFIHLALHRQWMENWTVHYKIRYISMFFKLCLRKSLLFFTFTLYGRQNF